MAISSIKDDVKNKKIRKCYLIYGQERFLINLNCKRITEAVMENCFSREMNMDIFEKAEDIDKVISACDTLPFMHEKRLVIVKYSGLFKAGRKEDSEKMAAYVSTLPESTVIVFVESEIDKRGKLFKAVLKEGLAEDCSTPKENELIRWAVSILKKSGIGVKAGAISYFFSVVGTDMENANSELKKLISYKQKGSEISPEDIDCICTKSLEAKVFDLVSLIGARKSSDAERLYRELIFSGDNVFGILSMIARQFRIMLQCKSLLSSGKTMAEIVKITGQKEFTIKSCISQSQNFTPEMLKSALKDCLDTQLLMVSGKMENKELAVEMLIIKHSR